MLGRYEDERGIGVLMGLGTQCRATTGQGCNHDIHYVTHIIEPHRCDGRGQDDRMIYLDPKTGIYYTGGSHATDYGGVTAM